MPEDMYTSCRNKPLFQTKLYLAVFMLDTCTDLQSLFEKPIERLMMVIFISMEILEYTTNFVHEIILDWFGIRFYSFVCV